VFVEIQFDVTHLVEVMKKNFDRNIKIALLGTVQFNGAIHEACKSLKEEFVNMSIPQIKPLSPGFLS
jgi:2-(3-amino-3-carboxypropyl)histidine synthase